MGQLGLQKNIKLDSISICITMDRDSEINLVYYDVEVTYKDKYIKGRTRPKKCSTVVDSDIFTFMIADLWYLRPDILKKVVDQTIEDLQSNLESTNWIFDELIFIELEMDDFK